MSKYCNLKCPIIVIMNLIVSLVLYSKYHLSAHISINNVVGYRSESAKENYTSLDETKAMLTSLKILISTLDKLKLGHVPTVPVIAPVPIVLHEPEVRIVEVDTDKLREIGSILVKQESKASLFDMMTGIKFYEFSSGDCY